MERFSSEQQKQILHNLFDNITQGIVYQDRNSAIITANPAAEKILGLTLDQMAGRSSLDPRWKTIHGDGSELPGEEHPSMLALKTGKPVKDILMGVFHPNEERHRWIIVNSIPEFENGDDRAVRVMTTFTDITERKLAEEHLRDSETLYRALFDSMNEGFAFHEVIQNDAGDVIDYRYIAVNPAFEKLTGLSQEKATGRTVRELIPNIEDFWIEKFGRVALTGESAVIENHVEGLDRWYSASAYSPEKGKFGVVFQDITEQKKLLRDVSERETELKVMFDSSAAGVIRIDTKGIIAKVNSRMSALFGYSEDEFIGMHYQNLLHHDHLEMGNEKIKLLVKGEIQNVSYERHYIRKDGSSFWGYLTGGRITDPEGGCTGLIGHIADITEIKEIQNSLIRAQDELSAILRAIPDMLFIISRDGTFVDCRNGDKDSLLMPPEYFIGKSMHEVLPSDVVTVSMKHLNLLFSEKNPQIYQYSLEIEGSRRFFEACLALKGKDEALAIVRDITERKEMESEHDRLEKQLLHAQKLESLGVLAGGIAHDFNNILTAIIGNAEMALMKLAPESPVIDNLSRIEKAAGRAADLARQMLAYSGKGRFIVEPIDVNRLVEEMGHMLEVSISKKAILRYNLTNGLPTVEADATQLRQVIMNLVINASEAIGDKSGVVAITTGYMDCDQSYIKDIWLEENLKEGLYLYLEISDTGCGMSKETLARIFDPFFTTKFTGRGLGMAAVLGIIRGHKGAIKVYSEEGKGTTFKILLPASEKPAQYFNGDNCDNNWRGGGTALLVDDEETVRGIGKEMLKELGYNCMTATDGREALEAYRNTPDIKVVILDLTMPHMDGEECFRELRKLDPKVKVIMSSGYNEQEVTQKFAGKGLAGFVQKPYKLSQLREALCRLELKNNQG